MTLPSCFAILNEQYFENLLLSVNSAASESELQDLITKVYGDISLLQSTLESQLALLGPIEALLTPPGASISDLVTWVSNYITNVLTPLFKPFATYTAQITALVAAVTTLSEAIETVATQKGFHVTIPSIETICTL